MKQLLLLLGLLNISGTATAPTSTRIWLGKVTAGYDVKKNETEIRKFYSLRQVRVTCKRRRYAYCRHCVKESLTLAATAAYQVPGEASVRLAAAL